MSPHIPTIFLLIVLINVTLSVFLGIAARRDIKNGIGVWAVGLAVSGCAYALLALRGQISDVLSIVLANFLVAISFALFSEGVGQFHHHPPRRWLVWLPVVATPVLFIVLISSQVLRMTAGAVIFSFQSALIIQALLAKHLATPGKGQYFLMAGFAGLIVMLIFQVLGAYLIADTPQLITAPSAVRATTFTVIAMCNMVIGLGLIVMVKDRAELLNRQLAMHDELTGLLNRRALMESLRQHTSQCQRSGQPLSLLMVDVDFFKRVNDIHGHLVGDQVLKKLAHTLQARARAQDVVGRFGGEEFLVLLPDTTRDGARILAESIREAVASDHFESEAGQTIAVTVSIGLSQQYPTLAQSCDDLIEEADRALYRAKQSGRNQVQDAGSPPADTTLPQADLFRA
ncbi:GGDEF domain-containing protein [Rhodoferax sp. 4810]|nr:GGDEF domain-containing protein [Rhodoferax jenense]